MAPAPIPILCFIGEDMHEKTRGLGPFLLKNPGSLDPGSLHMDGI